MTLHDILKVKGTTVYTTHPQATLQDVVNELVRRNVGSLLVCERDAEHGERVVGIITERDILHVTAAGRGPMESIRVSEAMSTELITTSPEDSVEEIMGLMTMHRVRHLPVLSKGRLVGMVSIGDIVKAQIGRLAMENEFMKNYIAG
jgi:CBS domain-containing protein